jgi:hypothetical protein
VAGFCEHRIELGSVHCEEFCNRKPISFSSRAALQVVNCIFPWFCRDLYYGLGCDAL